MAKLRKIERLKNLLGAYRCLVDRLVEDGLSYTDEQFCPFCSGGEGAESAEESDSGEIEHSPTCPTREAEDLRAIEI